uniref:Calcineurin-binding protein cabin-1 MEF2-binding domain-containing protein n=1 Tax=Scylla olivacea TaxID=85551 RepID=A0A0P4W3M8_SCYOL
MTRIAALNDWSLGSSEEDDVGPTREALEAQATKYYNEAINYLAHGNDEQAHHHFSQVLQNPYVEKANWPEGGQHQGGGLPQDVALKYSCLKNLGNLATKRGDSEQAAKHYLEAVQLDNTEVTLWQRLGASAIKIKDFELALVAFQEGLNVNPNHWPCMDQLMSVLFILEMYMDCLGLAISSLKQDPGYVKANAFKDKIFELQPSLIQDAKAFFPDSSVLFRTVDYDKAKGEKFIATCESLRPAPKVPRVPSPLPNQCLRESLQRLTWENLAQALISTYDVLVEADGMEFAARIDVHDALKLREEMKTDETGTCDANKETETQEQEAKGESNKDKEEIAKTSEGPDSGKQKPEQGGSSSGDECRTGNKTPTSEERLDGTAVDGSENSLTPRRISGRRHTIELGESQDSFRVAEKRRSLDSDTQNLEDDLKGDESVRQEDTATKDRDGHEPKKLCVGIHEEQKEGSAFNINSVPSAAAEGITKASETPGVGDGGAVSEKSRCGKDGAEIPTSFPHFSRQGSVSDSRDKSEDVAVTERDSAQTSEPKHPAREDEKTERPETTQDEKLKDINDETNKPESQPPQETLSEGISLLHGNLQEIIEKTIGPENSTIDEPQQDKEDEIQQEQEINAEKPLMEGDVEEREAIPEGKEGISNIDSGFKEQEEVVTEQGMLINQPERETYCEEEEDRQLGEHQEDGMEEELRGGIEQEEQVVETDMIQMQVEEEEGSLEEEPEVGVEGVTETEEAVNTLKDIMALQPTEILGLPEPDEFDYAGEYVEYFEGGVYEDDELENMNNDGTYVEGEGADGMGAEQEQMEQMALEQEEMNERIQEPSEGMEQEMDNTEQVEMGEQVEANAGMEMVDGAVEGMGQQEAEFVDQDVGVEGGAEQEEAEDQAENQEEEYNQMMERNAMEEMEVERGDDELEEEGMGGEEERGRGQISPESSPPKATEKENKENEEQEPSAVRQTRNSTEDDSTRNESDNNPEDSEANASKPTTTNANDTKTDNKEQKEEGVAATPDTTSQAQGNTTEAGKTTQATPGTVKKPKRHKRGLERELEQLDYWGRRQERDAKRRRRTISSKLLGSIEEAEYLTWADLLKSFLPSSLLNANVEERNKAKTSQPQTSVSQGKTEERTDVTSTIAEGTNKSSSLPAVTPAPPNPAAPASSQSGEGSQSKVEEGGEAGTGARTDAQEGDKTTLKEEEDAPKFLTDPNTQGSLSNGKSAANKTIVAMEVDDDPRLEGANQPGGKEGKVKEEEDVEAELRRKRKEIILSPLSSEEEQVEAFLLCHEENGGILHLLQLCLLTLYRRHLKAWPSLPAKLFTEIYPRVRNHVPHRPALSLQEDWTRLHEDTMLSLTHWELVLSLYQVAKQDTLHSKLKNPFTGSCEHLDDDLVHLTLMLGRGDVWVQEAPQFHTRLRWLQAQVKVCQDQPEEAVKHLELLLLDLDRLADPNKEYVVECAKAEGDPTLVNNTEVRRHLNFLQRSHMLEQVVDNYTCNRYQMVAELLTSIFHEPPPKARPGVTLPTRQTQLVILMDSLLKLKDFKGVLSWGAPSLAEALKRYNRAEAEEEKNRWAKTLMIITDSINSTLVKDVTYLDSLGGEKLLDLVNTLIQVLVVQLEKPQSAQVLPLETLTPWIVLHRMLSHEEKLQRQAEGKQEAAGTRGSSTTSQQEGSQATDASGSPGDADSGEGADKKAQEKESSEEESPSDSKGSEVPYPSTLFLITAHDELGKHSWCCYDDGVFLLYCLDVLVGELSRPLDTQHRQLLHHTLEQISFCLYSHPSKKSKHKHLRDHGVPQIALCWERALQLFRYYCPTQLPDFQSSQIPSITDDVASFLKRIVALFPDDARPENKVSVVDAFISGEVKDCSAPAVTPPTEEVRDCFYLLGDYYFKNKEWNNAIKYYKIDVVMNPDRLDSWAPLGLAMKAIMETQLNSCEVIENEEEFFAMAQRGTRCFYQALKLDEYHTNLWVEFGGLVYMVHSHASRLLKQDLNPDISIETFEMLEKLKGEMLSQAEQCFTQALKIQEEGWDDDCLPDERWLHCYMLGKVAEKKGKDPKVILEYYIKASQHLHQIQAKYPAKINYNSPQEYSVEALEMYYRIHAYILKYLQVKEGKSVEKEVMDIFTKVLDEMANSPFVLCQEKKKSSSDTGRIATSDLGGVTNSNIWGELSGGLSSTQKKQGEENDHNSPAKPAGDDSKDTENIVKEVVHDIISDAVNMCDLPREDGEKRGEGKDKDSSAGPKASGKDKDRRESDDDILVVEEKVIEKYDHITIIQRCINALKLCLVRFPQNYKALYRLAYYNNTSKFHKDSSRARNYMLGCDFWQRVGYMPVNGLFNERKVWIQQPKNCNFFHGVWRIPNDEVDRPGSFAAHMYRCVSLILDILPQLKDFYAVLQIALALKNSPEKDKKYLRDNERELLSEHATQVGLQAMKDKYKFLFKGSSPAHNNRRMAFLLDVYRSYKQISRHLPGSEPHLAKMVTETYAGLRGIEPDSRANLLREADAFCNRNQHVQHRLPQSSGPEAPLNINRTPFPSRRGRPPGTGRGRGRGRGSLYPSHTNPNMLAIQEAYKMYENVVNTRAVLNNQNLDRAAIFKHQKELEYYQTELSKYMSIPSVTQYFRATLESVGIMAKDKLPPPTAAPSVSKASPSAPSPSSSAPSVSNVPASRITQPTPVPQISAPQQAPLSQPKPVTLPGRSQIHGISITTVNSPKTTNASLNKPLKPNMSVTVSPIKSSCPPALQGRGEISVITVTRSSVSTRPSSITTTTATITTTSKVDPTPSVIKTPTTSPKPVSMPSDSGARDLPSTVPKLPAGTTIIHPRDSPNKPSGPRPQLQAQARPAKTQNTDSALDGLSSPMRKVAAEIIATGTGPTTTRPSGAPKPVPSATSPKPSLPKGMTITPAPRIKSHSKVAQPPARTTAPSTTSSSPSSFAGSFSAPVNKSGRAGVGGTSASVSATVIGLEGRRPIPTSTSQPNKPVQVTQLSPSQLMQLAYNSREGGGNISGLLNQYSKNVVRQSTPQTPAAAPRQQTPATPQQRPLLSNPQRDMSVRPPLSKPPPPPPQQQQSKPDQAQRRSSDDIIVLD